MNSLGLKSRFDFQATKQCGFAFGKPVRILTAMIALALALALVALGGGWLSRRAFRKLRWLDEEQGGG